MRGSRRSGSPRETRPSRHRRMSRNRRRRRSRARTTTRRRWRVSRGGPSPKGTPKRLGGRQPDRAAHAGATQPAIAVRVLGQVLLVIGLRVEELAGGRELGRDLAVAGLAELLLEHRAGGLGGFALAGVRVVD